MDLYIKPPIYYSAVDRNTTSVKVEKRVYEYYKYNYYHSDIL